MTQSDLFGDDPFDPKPAIGHNHPETSFKAAKKAERALRGKCLAVYRRFQARGLWGATDDELFAYFPGEKQNTLRPNRNALMKRGYIKDSGQERLNRSGNSCIVWVINPDKAPPQ